MKVQFARRWKRCAYPPNGKYISNAQFQGNFEDIEISDNEFKFQQLRPDGNRQPAAEADILSNIRARAQGRAAFPDADVRDVVS